MSEELKVAEAKIAELKKEVDDLKINNRVITTQVNSHKEVINQLMQENLNARTNFNLSQQYLNESVQNASSLNAELEKHKKENEELKKQIEELSFQLSQKADAA